MKLNITADITYPMVNTTDKFSVILNQKKKAVLTD